MDPIYEHHLARTVRQLIEGEGQSEPEVARYVEAFFSDTQQPTRQHISFRTHCPAMLVLEAVARVLQQDGFDTGKGVDPARRLLRATIEKEFLAKPVWLNAIAIPRGTWRLRVRLAVTSTAEGDVTAYITPPLTSWLCDFRDTLLRALRATPPAVVERAAIAQAATAPKKPGNNILFPGEPLRVPYTGTLRDYSGCATIQQVRDLGIGNGAVLPLGRWAFIMPPHDEYGRELPEQRKLGPLLGLAPLSVGDRARPRRVLREHQGALICAPQNSGKTELLLDWARAANCAGYNLLIVDVKGNMREKLLQGHRWCGELYHLTTDPVASPGRKGCTPNHALNLFAGIDPRENVSIQRVRQIAEALLPADGLAQGETRVWRNNWLNWLTGLIHLALLHDWYRPMRDSRLDLSDIYDLASDEGMLIQCLREIDANERAILAAGMTTVEPGLATWFADIAVLLKRETIVASHEGFSRPALVGERAEYSYRWLTEQIANALRPFRRYGLLYDKISGRLGLPHFALDRLAGVDARREPTDDPVTVIVAAREQELDEAQTLLTLVIVKLQHALYDRMQHMRGRQLKPVLLLLDETRRIRNFKVNEYVSYAREAQAGCVVVYQSLDQIGSDAQIRELLSNVGTQIYLGSLSNSTAAHLIATLPIRHRQKYSFASTADGGTTLTVSNEEVPFFSTADLHVLPAGHYPGLIYLREHPARAPILVTLDRDLVGKI